MRVIQREEWGANYGDGASWRDLPATESWLHHSVTSESGANASWNQDVRDIRAIDQIGYERFGWTYGFPYTYGITPSGRIFAGHNISKMGAHTSGHNRQAVGIVFVGNYEQRHPTAAQKRACAWLLNHLHGQGWLTINQLTGGHRDTKATACPGINAYNSIGEINHMARNQGSVSSEEEEDDMGLQSFSYDPTGDHTKTHTFVVPVDSQSPTSTRAVISIKSANGPLEWVRMLAIASERGDNQTYPIDRKWNNVPADRDRPWIRVGHSDDHENTWYVDQVTVYVKSDHPYSIGIETVPKSR